SEGSGGTSADSVVPGNPVYNLDNFWTADGRFGKAIHFTYGQPALVSAGVNNHYNGTCNPNGMAYCFAGGFTMSAWVRFDALVSADQWVVYATSGNNCRFGITSAGKFALAACTGLQ